jgi:ParB-like chromosome segregation protein Spo0J
VRFPTLPVSLLDDGFINSGDYPDWPSTCWTIKRHPADREILDELLRSIPEEGVLEPLTVGVWLPRLSFYLSDGHHRAVALMELGIREFPYRWAYKRHGHPLAWAGREPLPEHLMNMLTEGVRSCTAG